MSITRTRATRPSDRCHILHTRAIAPASTPRHGHILINRRGWCLVRPSAHTVALGRSQPSRCRRTRSGSDHASDGSDQQRGPRPSQRGERAEPGTSGPAHMAHCTYRRGATRREGRRHGRRRPHGRPRPALHRARAPAAAQGAGSRGPATGPARALLLPTVKNGSDNVQLTDGRTVVSTVQYVLTSMPSVSLTNVKRN